jgi:hypothetical protein
MARNPLKTDRAHEQHIRERAYHLWESDGKPHGRDVEYWARARKLVDMEEGTGSEQPLQPAAIPDPPRMATAKKDEPQQNRGGVPDPVADQGGAQPAPAPKRRSRAKPKKPA